MGTSEVDRRPTLLRQSDSPQAGLAPSLMWAAFVAILIGGPWFAAGYIFGTDWPGPRRFDFPTALSSAAPLKALLAGLSVLVSAQATGKLFVLAPVFIGSVLAYQAAPAVGFVPRAAAATVYVVNPFVYARMHYGQFGLLLAYAVMPWVALRLRSLLAEPSVGNALAAAIAFLLVGVLSPHLFVVSSLLGVALVATRLLLQEKKAADLKRLGNSLLVFAIATVAASSFWVIPVLLGRGSEGTEISGIASGDLAAYKAVADPQVGLIPNLLGLYGFWAEGTGRFTSMKAFVPIWPAVLAALLLVAAVGAVYGFRQKNHVRVLVVGLLAAAFVGLLLETGVSSPLTAGLVRWLDANFAPYRGMRDAGKWAALLALVYSQLVALGVAAILIRLRERIEPRARADSAVAIGAALLIALPLYYGNGLLFGMHGEIKPSQYPAGWYAADRVLAADAHPGRTLVLPWHEYMSYSFVHNQNSVIGPPQPTFFSVPVLVSADPEVPGVAPPTDRDQTTVSALVRAGPTGQWAQDLASLGVKYVLVAREVDWRSYSFLDAQNGLQRVGDFGSILLYRNLILKA